MKTHTLVLTTLFVVGFAFTSCNETKKDVKKTETVEVKETVKEETIKKETTMVEYQCPMKCEEDKVYHEPGQCPKCNMDLKKVGENSEAKEEENHEGHDHE